MARLAHRRLIALVVLLCQVAAAANVPMVHGQAVGDPGSGRPHCAQQAPPEVSSGTGQPSTSRTDHARHPGSCDHSCCQCPCAQAAALARTVDVCSATTRLPVIVSYRTLDLAQVANVFFRPPI